MKEGNAMKSNLLVIMVLLSISSMRASNAPRRSNVLLVAAANYPPFISTNYVDSQHGEIYENWSTSMEELLRNAYADSPSQAAADHAEGSDDSGEETVFDIDPNDPQGRKKIHEALFGKCSDFEGGSQGEDGVDLRRVKSASADAPQDSDDMYNCADEYEFDDEEEQEQDGCCQRVTNCFSRCLRRSWYLLTHMQCTLYYDFEDGKDKVE